MKAISTILVSSPLLLANGAGAAFVTYDLNRTNGEPDLLDGVQYAQVRIDDSAPGQLDFIVTPAAVLSSLAVSTFGIQTFGFNVVGINPLTDASGSNAQWTLPSGWTVNVAPPPNQQDGFGRFEVMLSGGGSNRQAPLIFSIKGTSLTLASFAELSTGSSVTQGAAYFAAHIAGFDGPGGVSSAFFAGSDPGAPANVPLPAAAGLLVGGGVLLGALGRRRRRHGG